MDYNYIILGDKGLYKYSFGDVLNVPYAKYISHPREKIGWLGILHKLHTSTRLNKIIPLPWKYLWCKYYFDLDFPEQKPICFLLLRQWVLQEKNYGIIQYIRNNFPNSKIVWFLQDLLQTSLNTDKSLVAKDLLSLFDLVLSIDANDCNKYGLVYHPLVFSSFHGKVKDMSYSDIYFLGQAKDRIQEIIKVFEFLRTKGLSLDFYIVGAKPNDRKYPDLIHYIDGMDYEENVQHIIHAKCLLEVMQGGQIGYTQRTVEAVCLGKKLLTNNSEILKAPFYNSRYVSSFLDISKIDNAFIESIKDNDIVDYNYKENLSPIELLQFIDERI